MKDIKYTIILYFLLVGCCSVFSQSVPKKQNSAGFILLSHVGNSNYFMGSIVLSVDSIKNIPYKKGVFDQYAKFGKYHNIILDSVSYDSLFLYLNVFKKCVQRQEQFIKKDDIVFIVDYRDNDGNDCKLLSLKDISEVLFTLRSLSYFLDRNAFEEDLKTYIKSLYNFYLDTYDPSREIYIDW